VGDDVGSTELSHPLAKAEGSAREQAVEIGDRPLQPEGEEGGGQKAALGDPDNKIDLAG